MIPYYTSMSLLMRLTVHSHSTFIMDKLYIVQFYFGAVRQLCATVCFNFLFLHNQCEHFCIIKTIFTHLKSSGEFEHTTAVTHVKSKLFLKDWSIYIFK